MTTKDGGPAFPHVARFENGVAICAAGMSLRDWFAGMALQGCLAGFGTEREEQAARYAYDYADAMLAEREKRHD